MKSLSEQKFKRYFYKEIEYGEIGYITLSYEITHEEALEQVKEFNGEYLKMEIVTVKDLDNTEYERLVG